MFAAAPRGSTAGTIGQASVKRPTLTSRNARLLSTDCHSPLYIPDQLSCARIDSRRNERRQAAERLLLAARLEVADQRVVLAHLAGALAGVVVEHAEVGRDARRYARDLLVDVELVVGAVEPPLSLMIGPPRSVWPSQNSRFGLSHCGMPRRWAGRCSRAPRCRRRRRCCRRTCPARR